MRGGVRKSNTNDVFIDVVVKQWFTVCVSLLNVHCIVEDAALEFFFLQYSSTITQWVGIFIWKNIQATFRVQCFA